MQHYKLNKKIDIAINKLKNKHNINLVLYGAGYCRNPNITVIYNDYYNEERGAIVSARPHGDQILSSKINYEEIIIK